MLKNLKTKPKVLRQSKLKTLAKKKIPQYLPKTTGIIQVPIELLNDFLLNSPKALRDFASIPTDAILPFYGDLSDYFDKFLLPDSFNPFNSKMLTFDPNFKCSVDDDRQRYIHVDLSVTKDSCGISMCHSEGFKTVTRLDNENKSESGVVSYELPVIKFDFTGRIVVPNGESLRLSDVRDLIIKLRDDLGFNVALVTFDRFQSVDSIQILQELGFVCGALSIDRTANVLKIDYGVKNYTRKINTDKQYSTPHEILRTAILDGRVTLPRVSPRINSISDEERDWSEEFEFNSQEFDVVRNVVYKSKHGTDDWIQSLAGSICNAVVNEIENIETKEDSINIENLSEDLDNPYNIDNPYEHYNVGIY